MELTTRCPHCAVEFQISLQQLQLRKGYIRCVNCAHIFDGYEAVVPAAASEPTVSSAPVASAPGPQFVVSTPEASAVPIRLREAPSTRADAPVFTVRDPVQHPQDMQRHTIGPEAPEPQTSEAGGDVVSGLYAEPRHDRVGAPPFERDSTRSGLGWGSVFWSMLVLLGLAGAVLQGAYIYRVQLASEFPASRPALEQYCDMLGCTVDYPRRLVQIVIMDSSMQTLRDATEPAAEDGIQRQELSVVLRNNFDRPQQWPSISVDLVDAANVVAFRRTLAPADYLPELLLQRPFPAQSEVRVSVPMAVEGAEINGYRLNTFFP